MIWDIYYDMLMFKVFFNKESIPLTRYTQPKPHIYNIAYVHYRLYIRAISNKTKIYTN